MSRRETPTPAAPSFLSRALTLARTEFAALSALFIVALGAVIFADLAEDMRDGASQGFDQAVLMMLHPYADDPGRPWGPWWLKEAASDITSLGGISVLGLFALIAIGFMVLLRKRLSAVLLVIGLAGGVFLSEGLKSVFERERPPEIYQAVKTINASFPSGHALLSAVFYLTLGVMLARAFPRRRLKAYVMAVAVLMTVLIGTSRIYLAAHWASDVFAGWSVGAAWAMALWLAAYGIERRQKTHHAALQDDAAPIASPVASED